MTRARAQIPAVFFRVARVALFWPNFRNLNFFLVEWPNIFIRPFGFFLALSQVDQPQKSHLVFWLFLGLFTLQKILLFHFFDNTFAKFCDKWYISYTF